MSLTALQIQAIDCALLVASNIRDNYPGVHTLVTIKTNYVGVEFWRKGGNPSFIGTMLTNVDEENVVQVFQSVDKAIRNHLTVH